MPFTIEAPKNDIPDGSYTATLERVEEAQGNFGKYRKWHFLLDVNGKLESLAVMTSANTGPRTKSYQWLTALSGGVAPQTGQTIEDPTGSRVILKIGRKKDYTTGAITQWPDIHEMTPFVEPTQVVPGVPR